MKSSSCRPASGTPTLGLSHPKKCPRRRRGRWEMWGWSQPCAHPHLSCFGDAGGGQQLFLPSSLERISANFPEMLLFWQFFSSRSAQSHFHPAKSALPTWVEQIQLLIFPNSPQNPSCSAGGELHHGLGHGPCIRTSLVGRVPWPTPVALSRRKSVFSLNEVGQMNGTAGGAGAGGGGGGSDDGEMPEVHEIGEELTWTGR